jgi:hypothetical protein
VRTVHPVLADNLFFLVHLWWFCWHLRTVRGSWPDCPCGQCGPSAPSGRTVRQCLAALLLGSIPLSFLSCFRVCFKESIPGSQEVVCFFISSHYVAIEQPHYNSTGFVSNSTEFVFSSRCGCWRRRCRLCRPTWTRRSDCGWPADADIASSLPAEVVLLLEGSRHAAGVRGPRVVASTEQQNGGVGAAHDGVIPVGQHRRAPRLHHQGLSLPIPQFRIPKMCCCTGVARGPTLYPISIF